MKNTVDRTVAASAFADSKPHYAILDGLRGVAALVVIWYHVFEGFATSPLDQKFNHGYLAVDFFFILSGFVVGYAYDDRWKGRPGDASGVRGGMRIRDFLKRRLVRLHPMVMLGSVLGAVTFLIQGSVQWNGTHVPFSEAWPWAVTVFIGSIVLAYIVLKVYDEPLRRWLGRKWLLQVR